MTSSHSGVRSSASGINRVAFFLAKDVVDHFNVVIKPVINYLSMFDFFNSPRSTFVSNFTVTLVLVYCVTGMAYTDLLYPSRTCTGSTVTAARLDYDTVCRSGEPTLWTVNILSPTGDS